MLLIIKPGSESFVPEVWLALLALFWSASRDLVTRFIDMAVPSIYVTFATSVVVTAMGLVLLPFETWIVPSANALMLLSVASGCLFFAYQFGVIAMRTGEIPVVAPFRYSMMVLALILGYGIWGHVPDPVSIVGICLVCGAGLYMLLLERGSMRRAERSTTITKAQAVS